MSKELEEAIEQYKELKRNKDIIETIEPKYFFEFADTMLNYIENSISKEKVEETIEDNGFEVHTREWGNVEVVSIEVLQELLEGK